MTLYNPAQPRDRPRVGDGRRRFDILTIGLHWATVTLIVGMFASAWLLLASDREHAAMLLTVHRSLGVMTSAVAIVRLGWRFSYAYLPPFSQNMPKVQQRLAKASEYGLYALLLSRVWRRIPYYGYAAVTPSRHGPSRLLLDGKHQRPELVLRRSIPGLRTPLSTLRLQPHDRTRMIRGRCGSLRLHRNGLAPSTFRRSPGAPVHSINSGIGSRRSHCPDSGHSF